MKIIMFLEEATNKNEAFRILNRYVRRWKHSRIDFERTEPVRIYWLWEDEKMFGSNFKSVLRRMGKYVDNIQKDIYNI